DFHVTGVQTCALPISCSRKSQHVVTGPPGFGLVCAARGINDARSPRLEPSSDSVHIGCRGRRAAAATGLEAKVIKCVRSSLRLQIGRATGRERVWISW